MDGTVIAERNELLAGSKGAVFQIAMVAAAAILPSACHLAGAPVKVLLPMHWPVIAAGLFCGWRAGLIAGAVSPLISSALSGMPAGWYLPLMAMELSVYGFFTGFAVERLRFKPFPAVLLSVAAGRAALLGLAAFFPRCESGVWQYFLASVLPGLPAAMAQAVLLPLVYRKFARKSA